MNKLITICTIFLLLLAPAIIEALSPENRKLLQREHREALIIGNQDYIYEDLRGLSNPVNDARAMEARLKGYGFSVVLKENATRLQMRDAIERFALRLKNNGGVGLFYYAGHGFQTPKGNYLGPVDLQPKEAGGRISNYEIEDGIAVGKLYELMEGAQARVSVVLLDACRENPLGEGYRSMAKGLKADSLWSAIDGDNIWASGSYISYATEPGGVADDGGGENGLYTSTLLEYMETPGLNIFEVLRRVSRSVDIETLGRQRPWLHSDTYPTFYFVLPPEHIRGGEMMLLPDYNFYMDGTEVTNEAFVEFLNEEGNQQEGEVAWLDIEDEGVRIKMEEGRYIPLETYAQHPVVEVSWYGAHRYCEWAGKRLPRIEEWLQAAGGREQSRFPWGAEIPGVVNRHYANYYQADDRDGFAQTAPVGSFVQGNSHDGLQDMAGNVWEW